MTGAPRERGWRIDLIPGKPLRREGRRVVVPLWLLRDGESLADLDLDLSPAEAGGLHARLSRALSGPGEPLGAPAAPRGAAEGGAVCAGGWRVECAPGGPVRREGAGRLVLGLVLWHGGERRADLELTLSTAEAQVLHARLSRALGRAPLPPGSPGARRARAAP